MNRGKKISNCSIVGRAAVGVLAMFVLGQSARADEPKKDWAIAYNFGATTDYVFRGVSQSAEKPAVQGGVDVTYKQFYVEAWISNVDFTGSVPGPGVGVVEIDYYAGIKFPVWKIDVDLGGIYYTYPGANDNFALTGFKELDYFEFKAAAKYKIIDPLTVGANVFGSVRVDHGSA